MELPSEEIVSKTLEDKRFFETFPMISTGVLIVKCRDLPDTDFAGYPTNPKV